MVWHRTALIERIGISSPEAGRIDAPALVLRHGVPCSSHVIRDATALPTHGSGVAVHVPRFGFPAAEERP